MAPFDYMVPTTTPTYWINVGTHTFPSASAYDLFVYGAPSSPERVRPPSRSGPTPYQRPTRALVAVGAVRMPERRGRTEARPSRALRQRRRLMRA